LNKRHSRGEDKVLRSGRNRQVTYAAALPLIVTVHGIKIAQHPQVKPVVTQAS